KSLERAADPAGGRPWRTGRCRLGSFNDAGHPGPASSRRFSRWILFSVSAAQEMKIVSIITDPRVVDRILRHLESQACRARDPFEPRAPPQPGGNSLQ